MTEKVTRRDFDALSDRRREAMALLDEGVSQSDVARELSVTRQTVSRWAKVKATYPDNGSAACFDGRTENVVRQIVGRQICA
jgi:predicted transcriptional regulator